MSKLKMTKKKKDATLQTLRDRKRSRKHPFSRLMNGTLLATDASETISLKELALD